MESKRKGKDKATADGEDAVADGMDLQGSGGSSGSAPSTGSSGSSPPPPKKFRGDGRIIVVSYRLPLEITLEEGGAEHRTKPLPGAAADGMEIAPDEDASAAMDSIATSASASASSSSSSTSTSSMAYAHHHHHHHSGPILPRRATARGPRNGKGTVVKRSRSPINLPKHNHAPLVDGSERALEDFVGLAHSPHNLRFDLHGGHGGSAADSCMGTASTTLPATSSGGSSERELEERELKELNSGSGKKKRWHLERQTKLVMKVWLLLLPLLFPALIHELHVVVLLVVSFKFVSHV
jgi:hypothetical protein